MSNKTGIHRDRLFTVAVSLAEIMLDDRNEKHQKAFEILEELSEHISKIETKIATCLGEDDPIPQRVKMINDILGDLLSAIEAELNRGIPIDGDDIIQSG